MKARTRSIQLFSIRLSLAVGASMLAIKWYAYAITGSAAILSDAAESVVHIMAVAFAAFSLWLSYRPPDEGHPYGHDKVSFFSVGMEGSLIIVAAAYIIYEAARKLLGEIVLTNLDTGMWFTLGASTINLVLGLYLVTQGKRSNSRILVANGKHVLTDSWTSFGVVAGLLLTLWTGWLPFDPWVAIAVALNIAWSGGKLVRQSVGGLMDERDPALGKTIKEVLDRETADRGIRYHELRHRETGNSVWIEYHLLFPGTLPLFTVHLAATEIEEALASSLDVPTRIVSHLEPGEQHQESHSARLRH